MRTATIVGSGPNGLTAGVVLARAGYRVRVLEAADAIGGAARTVDAPVPGYRFDVGSAVHPAGYASPVFRAMRLPIQWITPEISYAHAFDDAPAALAWRDIERTADGLGAAGPGWRRLLAPLSRRIDEVTELTGDHLRHLPRRPITAARFGARALQTLLPSSGLGDERAAALLTGTTAHANTLLPSLVGAGAGLLLAAHAHAGGWPLPAGGAGAITDALAASVLAAGGEIRTGTRVRDLSALDWGDPDAGDLLLLDTSPRLLHTAPGLPGDYARALRRYRYGPGVAKLDLALSAPVPWRDPALRRAVTIHLGGSRARMIAAERAVAAGGIPHRPYVIVVQPHVIDPSRAPAGTGVLWAYTHVPAGSRADPAAVILAELERHAPGVGDLVLGAVAGTASSLEHENPSLIGGDIAGGSVTMRQMIARPVLSAHPWRTPLRGVYLCSSATPPGPAVHGRNGWLAARTALQDATGVRIELDDLFAS